MRIGSVIGRKLGRKRPKPEDVIREQLATAYAIHPGHLMPGAVMKALSDAGFRVISEDDLQDEIALAHQAGYTEGAEA